jgi:hypothetical protein
MSHLLRTKLFPMKLRSMVLSSILCIILFGSCLKDTPFLDVSNTQPLIEFGLSPANGFSGPYLYAGDTAGIVSMDTAIALVIASPQVLNKAVNITIRVDTTQISAFNATDTISFSLLPSNLYTLPDTVITIPAGYRVGRIPVTLNLGAFPATHNYALPLTIVDGGGIQINTSNGANQFMWLFSR